MLVACLTVTACHAKSRERKLKDTSTLDSARCRRTHRDWPTAELLGECLPLTVVLSRLASTKLKRRAAAFGMGSNCRRVGGDAHADTTFVLTERDSD